MVRGGISGMVLVRGSLGYSIKDYLADQEDFDSEYKGELMQDGKIFSPAIHRRYLPSQYIGMVQGEYLMKASPRKFTWDIRRWLGMEIATIIRMKPVKQLNTECKIRASFLGKEIFSYLISKENVEKNLVYGRGIGNKDGYHWVYKVSEEWIAEHLVELYNAYLAEGCYYTITSLQAYGKLGGNLEGTTSSGETLDVVLLGSQQNLSKEDFFSDSSEDLDLKSIRKLVNLLKTDKCFRDSLSKNCLQNLNIEAIGTEDKDGIYLKNTDNAIELFAAFYKQEMHTNKASKELYAKYNIPIKGEIGVRNGEIANLYIGY